MDLLIQALPLLAIVALFWLLVIRPAQRRQKETSRMQAALEPGQRVMLTSGVFATVVSLAGDRARVALAEGVEIEVLRAAIGTIDRSAEEHDATEADQPGADRSDAERPEDSGPHA